MTPSRRTLWKDLVNRGLRIQVRIFLIVFLVTAVIDIQHVIVNHVNPLWALLGLAIGLAIGIILARTKPMEWDHSNSEVAASNSVLGVIAIVIYLIFVFNRDDIISNWISDADIVGVVAMAITSGVMLGRVWITFHGIRAVVRSATLAPDTDH